MTCDERDETERPETAEPRWSAPRFIALLAGAGALCFALGFAVMLALAQLPEAPDPLLGLAVGQDDIGGLL